MKMGDPPKKEEEAAISSQTQNPVKTTTQKTESKKRLKIESESTDEPSTGPSCSNSLSGSACKIYRSDKMNIFDSEIGEENNKKCEPRTMLEKMQKTSPYNLFFTTISNSPETSKEDNCITFTVAYPLFINSSQYKDGSIRIVVSTANLFYDWDSYNQGLWVSPKLKKLPEGSTVRDGESLTGFKSDFLNYLSSYNLHEFVLKKWVTYVEAADFSEVKVAFVSSTPGKHGPNSNGNHLHRVGELLSQYCILPEKTRTQSEDPSLSWKVIAQASSIGSLGDTSKWLTALLSSLANHQRAIADDTQVPLCLVYPSQTNVENGYFGLRSGGCLTYSKSTNDKQRGWLQTYMHQWIADGKHRTRAMPHIKSYCRVSPDSNKLAYFLLTSANLSKAAWGDTVQKDNRSYVKSYEAGVMFLPKFFDEDFFEIQKTSESKNNALFPFMLDLPLTPYTKDDHPYYSHLKEKRIYY